MGLMTHTSVTVIEKFWAVIRPLAIEADNFSHSEFHPIGSQKATSFDSRSASIASLKVATDFLQVISSST